MTFAISMCFHARTNWNISKRINLQTRILWHKLSLSRMQLWWQNGYLRVKIQELRWSRNGWMKNEGVGVVPDDCLRIFLINKTHSWNLYLGLIGKVITRLLYSVVNITTNIHHKNGGAGSAWAKRGLIFLKYGADRAHFLSVFGRSRDAGLKNYLKIINNCWWLR